ncbi:D-alanyl-D-alanine carboxypeptidase/D-alanyl-D-alanine endopeptidase [Pseudotabrizicola alkalilacus]|uniref:D-alanyl-D-alanine carboxypeptidase/D-alanyl-D-alanine-endopeptidase n=1 Tax=Pseudotabrizicola alkalilacus TaxID=2305252 RepID=A0A411Z5I7_9RHOB|nr:D-alanyl-D-alanine carboxypeptidase/D-alanyl-D-alanine-endopeptidase [Pseudotabrizicola alkalilacus]RGP38346.1 D-alanyl-D-alanine carboxypeptidase/D-alanyl-D-alanine-endopeptidase [Pseudotabrizicola alkalilacus]
MISKGISRRQILGGLLAGAAVAAAVPGFAEAPARSPRPVPRGGQKPALRTTSAEALIAAAKLGEAAVASYVVMDAASGTVLEQREAQIGMPPASVAKAVTALYALARLGPGFRFRTRVLATGPVVAGVVQGDILLVGAGDPTLQTDQLGDLAAALAARGVKSATGRFLTWDRALPPVLRISDEQPVQVGYNPSISGLNLNFNRVHFEWKRANNGWSTAMDARGDRFVPAVRMARMQVVSRDTPVFTYQTSDAADEWTVAAGALGKGGSRWLPVRHPAVYVGEVFQTLAKAQGITLSAPQPLQAEPSGQELAAVESAPLPEILRDMLRFSTNITAEALGLRASGAADLAASGAAMSDWARATYGVGCRFVDHSGLGSASRVTAQDMAQIIRQAHMAGAGVQPLFRNLGLRDAKGKEIANHPVRVTAKSGTLNFVSGLAGHIRPPQGRELIFAIFLGDTARRDALAEADREAPPGGQAWTARARSLQWQLLARWSGVYA